MKRFFIILLVATAVVSCRQVDNPKTQFLKFVQPGVITNNIKCKSDPTQSYCIYVPVSYDVNRAFPVVYAFDPHGTGSIPVTLMKNIAEKLGYIVIGSNNCRNGLRPEEVYRIVNILFADTQQKLSIDTNSDYLLGFSGGARIACMIAQGSNFIKGVIACSAGFKPNKNPLGFRFIGIAGSQDMNYLEMKQLNSLMDSVGIQNQFISFRGNHKWPDEKTISEALTMLEVYSHRDASPNKSIANELLSQNIKRIQDLKSVNYPDSLALAYSIAKRTYQTVDGLIDVVNLKSIVEELNKNQVVQEYLKEQKSIERYENDKQTEFLSSFGSKDEVWWDSEIAKLNMKNVGSKVDVSQRLLGFISLNCYGYVNGALHYQDWKAAKYFTSIYSKADPKNPDSWYALACLQANTDKLTDAIESLKKAIKFGFSDFDRIQNDPLLIKIRGMEGYGELLKTK